MIINVAVEFYFVFIWIVMEKYLRRAENLTNKRVVKIHNIQVRHIIRDVTKYWILLVTG